MRLLGRIIWILTSIALLIAMTDAGFRAGAWWPHAKLTVVGFAVCLLGYWLATGAGPVGQMYSDLHELMVRVVELNRVPTTLDSTATPIDEAIVERAIDVALQRSPNDPRDLFDLLKSAGLAPHDAWRIAQIIPNAFVHVAFRDEEVQFSAHYNRWNSNTGRSSLHRFADEPVYRLAVASAERRILASSDPGILLPLVSESAEYRAMTECHARDGSIRGMCFTEPLLVSFEDPLTG
jgi:hypothetical protein